MKKLTTLTVFCLTVFMSAAQIEWSNPMDVAANTFGNTRPIVKLINDSIPIVMWSKASTDVIYISRWEDGAFSTPYQISPAGMSVTNYGWSGPEMDTYGESVFVTFRANPWATGLPYLMKSTDGGIVWSDTIRIDNFGANHKAYFPKPSAISENRLTVTFMHHDGFDNDPQYAYVTSTDGGLTFSDTTDISRQFGAEACDCCTPAIAGNGDNQVIVYRNNDNNVREFRGLFSSDSGETFNTVVNIDTSGWVVNACPSSAAQVELFDQHMVTVFMSDNEVFLSKTSLPSGTLDATMLLSSAAGAENYPAMASNGDSLIVIWEAFGNSSDLHYNVMKSDLSDFNAANEMVFTDSAASQSKPSVAFGADGTLHVVYMDGGTGTVKYVNNRPQPVDGALKPIAKQVRLYPNPATNSVRFSLRSVEQVKVLSATGAEMNVPLDGNELDLTGLSRGMYVVRIQTAEGMYTSHLTVQ